MADQFSLPGFEPPPDKPQPVRGRNTLFFALVPVGAAADNIASKAVHLRNDSGLTGKLLLTGRLHVTLHELGGFDEMPHDIVEAAKRAAAAVTFAPFEVVFDRVLSFSGSKANKPFVLGGSDHGMAALNLFREKLRLAMAANGLPTKPRRTPHLTLLYDRRFADERSIEPITWTANRVVLIYSHVGLTFHEWLAEWPLRG